MDTVLDRSGLEDSVQSLSHVRLFVTLCTGAHQASLSITNSWSLIKLTSIELVMPSNHFKLTSTELVLPSNHLILCRPLFSRLQSFPAPGSFQTSQFFASDDQSFRVSASASVLPINIQDRFPLGLTGLISSQPRDSQESSPTPQFKIINSSVLSFLYSSTLTFIHDYWKNHNFD